MNRIVKIIIYIFLCLIFLIGLFVFLYPFFSDFIFNISLQNEIKNYKSKVNVLSNDDFDEKILEAMFFNEQLLENSLVKNKSIIENTNYRSLLSIDDSGIMGYLIIPKIDVNIPIYHGSDKNILQRGIGHYEGSSFPIKGESVHAVLVGHTGLPSAKLISDLDKMQVGDGFEVVVMNRTYRYEVDQIKTVWPDDLSDLEIVRGKQYVTIVTCTPYGINSHRLLVRGELKVDDNVEEVEAERETNGINVVYIVIGVLAVLAIEIMIMF